MHTVDLSKVGLNLTATRRGLKGAQAIISQNMDHADASGALAGRLGTTTIAGAQALGGKPLDLYRAYNGVTGRFLICTFDDGVNIKVAAWENGDSAFATLQQGGGDFTLTRSAAGEPRVSFCTSYDPTVEAQVVAGTNGVDAPFYWDFSGDVTSFQFGTIDTRLKNFVPVPWKGRRWAYLRSAETVTLHGSDVDDHTKFIDEGDPVFFQVPQDRFENPLRAIVPFKNQLAVFNLNSINNVYFTNDSATPFKYTFQADGIGAINARCVSYWNNNIIFLSKTEPYLFLWDGSRTHRLDPQRILTKGIQEWVNFSVAGLASVRMDVHGDVMYVAFTASGDAPGADSNRWVMKINLSRLNERGNPFYPATVDKIRANDIINADASTDAGQLFYTDDSQNYVRRYYDFFDGDSVYGDNNAQTGSEPDAIDYILQLGWDDFRYPGFKRLTEFWLDCDYEGTPVTTDTLKIEYRFAPSGDWQQLLIGATRTEKPIPFPLLEWFKEMQFKFTWTTKTARPFLYGMKIWYQPKKYRQQ